MEEIKSLSRGLKILKIMADVDQSISVTALAEQLDVDKATASRTVRTLMAHGFVEKASDGRRYQLGPELVKLSSVVIDRLQLRETAKPYLDRLVTLTGECAHLAIYSQGQALYIDQVESDNTLRVNVAIGHMAPLHCTALGKVLLACGNHPIPEQLEGRTPTTITSRSELLRELEQVRQQGFAVDDEEYDRGVRCIAAPISDYRNRTIAAIGISGPAVRIGLENIDPLAQQVLVISQELSERFQFER